MVRRRPHPRLRATRTDPLIRAVPRRDIKRLEAILGQFGTFAEAMKAPGGRLREVPGLGEAAITEIELVRAAALRLMWGEALERRCSRPGARCSPIVGIAILFDIGKERGTDIFDLRMLKLVASICAMAATRMPASPPITLSAIRSGCQEPPSPDPRHDCVLLPEISRPRQLLEQLCHFGRVALLLDDGQDRSACRLHWPLGRHLPYCIDKALNCSCRHALGLLAKIISLPVELRRHLPPPQ
jgi:hypothetical protein